jgi:ubiquinone/menaquinone biosynthesis C-methylase UbiE
MEKFDKQQHWENIYQTKSLSEVSWYEPNPKTSLDFVKQFNIAPMAKIIDIGGGDSLFVDYLLNLGFQDVTVLDISETAIERAKLRLGDKANQVKWIVADAANFKTSEKYDFWHDRAAFHFFTEEKDIKKYIKIIRKYMNVKGILVIGTFSENGPKKCSGIPIKQYSETSMTARLLKYFQKIKCITVEHITPFATMQQFVFCSFRLAN